LAKLCPYYIENEPLTASFFQFDTSDFSAVANQ
jgi:hypothetical protein